MGVHTELKKVSLTQTQNAIWLESRLHAKKPLFIIGAFLELNGRLDSKILKQSILNVVQQHDALRISIPNLKEPSQVVNEIQEVDLVERAFQSKSNAKSWMTDFFKENIELDEKLLFQFALVSFGDNASFLILKFHHLIMDGWARGLFLSKIVDQYNAILNQELIDDSSSFIDYAVSIKAYDGDKSRSLSYWKDVFSSYEKEPLFKSKKDEAIVDSSERFEREIGVESYANIAFEGNYSSKSRFYFVLATLFLTLAKRLGKSEIVFGIPLLNRRTAEEKQTIGCFINIIPLKLSYNPNQTFSELVAHIKNEIRSTIPYRGVSNHEINQALGINFSNSTQLYDVLFAYEKNDYDLNFGGIEVVGSGTLSNDAIQTPLVVHWFDFHENGPVKFAWDYNLKYLNREDVKVLDDRFQMIYDHFLLNHHLTLNSTPYLSAEELETIDLFAIGGVKTFSKEGIMERMKSVLDAKPHSVALIDEQGSVTYSELWSTAQFLAYELKGQGFQSNQSIAILLPRSKDYVCAIAACLLAGGYFIPIDIELPKHRIIEMITEAGVEFAIVKNGSLHSEDFLHLSFVHIGQKFEGSNEVDFTSRSPSDPAYCIFTSGTTGTPKGVLISSNSLLNLLDSLDDHVYSKYPAESKLGMLSAFHFDASIQHIFACLLLGRELTIIPEWARTDGTKLAQCLSDFEIEICDGVSTHISAMIAGAILPSSGFSVRHFMLGGEKLSSDLVDRLRRWMPNQDLLISNLYGPTETTVDATIHTFSLRDYQQGEIPIGRPLHHVNVWVLSEKGELLPQGVEGQIVIGGKGLSIGYLNQPVLTKSRFVQNPYLIEKIYLTGDRGHFDSSGQLFIKGRFDNQVKVRGYRIELSDIESNLIKLESVSEAKVLEREVGGSQQLIGFVTGVESSSAGLKDQLKAYLPSYMIPYQIMHLKSLPTNRTGKVDSLKLLELAGRNNSLNKAVQASLSPTEKSLLEIYKDVLELDFVDVNDGFFDLGGDSLSLVFLLARVEEVFDKELSMMQFSTKNSVRAIARILDEEGSELREVISVSRYETLLGNELSQANGIEKGQRKVAFLTGATGFVGAFMLSQLLDVYEEVFCLVRAESIDHANEKLRSTLDRFEIEIDSINLNVVLGDLSMSQLGLNQEAYTHLSKVVDVVYHCGAQVDFLADFDTLYSANVSSTIDLMRFCSVIKKKQFNFISTKGVFTQLNTHLHEQTPLVTQIQYKDHGYKSTKWLADHLTQQARKHGVETNVFRLARITGSSINGRVRSDDFFHRFMLGCIALKSFPKELLDHQIDLTPADITAKTIVELSFTHSNQNFHIINNEMISYRQIIGFCLNEGLEINLLDYDDWMKDVNLLNSKDQHNPLFPITGLLKNKGWVLREDISFQNEFTLCAMRKHGLYWPSTSSLWNSYLLDCLKSFRGTVDTSRLDNTKHIT